MKLQTSNRLFAKRAAAPGDGESSFEQAFASLAFTYLKDRAPKLLDKLIGFQLLEKSEDNSRAVGLFGFKLGDQWLYAPVFFLNGDLKGRELLYVKNQDAFIPLEEGWVDYLLNRKPQLLGEPAAADNLADLGVSQPNMQRLIIPPRTNKFGSARRIASWARPFVEKLPELTSPKILSEKFAGLDSRLSLPKALDQHVELAVAAARTCDRFPHVKRAMDKWHGSSLLPQALKSHRSKAANAKRPSLLDMKTVLSPPTKRAEDGVVVHTVESVMINVGSLSDEEKERLLRDGYVVEDRRGDALASVVYNAQQPFALTNPTESNLYDVVVKPGEFDRCLVVTKPHTCHGPQPEAIAVSKGEGRKWVTTHPSKLWTQHPATREEYQDWIASLPEKDALSVGGMYLLLTRTGEGTAPFRVVDNLGGGRYKVSFSSCHCYGDVPGGDRYGPHELRRDPYIRPGYDEEIQFNSRSGTSFKSYSGELYVPQECRVLTLSAPDDCCLGGSRSQLLHPGSLGDLQMHIRQKTARLKVSTDGHALHINNGPGLSKVAALTQLIVKHGLREEAAKQVLKEAAARTVMTYRIKYADGMSLVNEGVGAPAFPEPYMNADPSFGSVPAYGSQTEFLPVQGVGASQSDPNVYNYMDVPDPMAQQEAQQLGQTGQREVFDASMISSLLKAVRKDSLVDKYMGDLFKALDRLGRILFLLYWHGEEFEDRYGKGDIPELEDALRNAFDAMGQVTLYLRTRGGGDLTENPFTNAGVIADAAAEG